MHINEQTPPATGSSFGSRFNHPVKYNQDMVNFFTDPKVVAVVGYDIIGEDGISTRHRISIGFHKYMHDEKLTLLSSVNQGKLEQVVAIIQNNTLKSNDFTETVINAINTGVVDLDLIEKIQSYMIENNLITKKLDVFNTSIIGVNRTMTKHFSKYWDAMKTQKQQQTERRRSSGQKVYSGYETFNPSNFMRIGDTVMLSNLTRIREDDSDV